MKRRIALMTAVILAISTLAACAAAPAASAGSTAEAAPAVEAAAEETAETADVPKSEQTGTAGSNIPLKDNMKEAEAQVIAAMQAKLVEMYGDQVDDSRIRIEKLYSTEDEQAFEPVKSMNLGPNEVAFELTMDLHPAEGADVNMLLIPNGELDEESGWVVNVFRLGVLRENTESSDPKYVITDFGTGW